MGQQAEPALVKLYGDANPRCVPARWLLSKLPETGSKHLSAVLADREADIRVTAIRGARQVGVDMVTIVPQLAGDPSPAVRRGMGVIVLAHLKSPDGAAAWTELATKHTGDDRWYLDPLWHRGHVQLGRLLRRLAGTRERLVEQPRRVRAISSG